MYERLSVTTGCLSSVSHDTLLAAAAAAGLMRSLRHIKTCRLMRATNKRLIALIHYSLSFLMRATNKRLIALIHYSLSFLMRTMNKRLIALIHYSLSQRMYTDLRDFKLL